MGTCACYDRCDVTTLGPCLRSVRGRVISTQGNPQMNSFSASVEAWHDCFTLLGASSVTLLGLLFVAVSLRDDIRKQADNAYLKQMVSQNLTSYLTVFLMSIFFLIPDATAQSIAISIAATVVAPLINSIRTAPLYRRQFASDRSLFVWYGLVQTLCYLAALIGALLLGRYEESALTTMLVVMIFLVIIPTNNAWQLTASTSDD